MDAHYVRYVERCRCRCHARPVSGVDVRDVLEALVACDQCRNDHCPAITAGWPWPYEPARRRRVVLTDATDATDEGEGAE